MLLSIAVPLIEAQDSQIWGNKALFPRLESIWCHWLESEVTWGGGVMNGDREGTSVWWRSSGVTLDCRGDRGPTGKLREI